MGEIYNLTLIPKGQRERNSRRFVIDFREKIIALHPSKIYEASRYPTGDLKHASKPLTCCATANTSSYTQQQQQAATENLV